MTAVWKGTVLAVFSMGIVACGEPVNSVLTPSVVGVKPRVAEGFRWRDCGSVEAPIGQCLEIVWPATGELLTTVYRDSSIWRVDKLRRGASVVLGDPSHGLATLSTTHVALIEAWDDSLEAWSGGAYLEWMQSEAAKKRLDARQAVSIGGTPEVDREKLLGLAPVALTIYPFGDPLSGSGLEAYIPVVPILEYLESHPLGRAEWMRVFGWMLGPESAESADRAFDLIAKRYEFWRNQAFESSTRMRVFTGSVEQGTWHAPGGDSFMARFIFDAGGAYVLDHFPGRENVQIPLEEMIALSQSADAWGLVFNHTDRITRSDLFAADQRNAYMVPPSGRVFVANTADCDYFGSWVARPDWMLINLIQLFHPELVMDEEMERCFEWLEL